VTRSTDPEIRSVWGSAETALFIGLHPGRIFPLIRPLFVTNQKT